MIIKIIKGETTRNRLTLKANKTTLKLTEECSPAEADHLLECTNKIVGLIENYWDRLGEKIVMSGRFKRIEDFGIQLSHYDVPEGTKINWDSLPPISHKLYITLEPFKGENHV